jgi:hypothetical protein
VVQSRGRVCRGENLVQAIVLGLLSSILVCSSLHLLQKYIQQAVTSLEPVVSSGSPLIQVGLWSVQSCVRINDHNALSVTAHGYGIIYANGRHLEG